MSADLLQSYTFSQLIEEGALHISDGYRAKNSELGGTGKIFLRAGHVKNDGIEFNGVDRFQSELGNKVQSKLSQLGDTIITTKGNSTGRTSFVTSGMPVFVYSPHLSFWRSLNTNRIDPSYLRYWSIGFEFRNQLYGLMAQTDMAPYLSLIDQKQLRITLPRIETQRKVGSILGLLDDKITLNRQINQTLERMAQALFKSWFIDFDPVKAKADAIANRRDPERAAMAAIAGKDEAALDALSPEQQQQLAATARLFPSRLMESELGLVPEGWEVKPLADILDVRKGLSYKGKHVTQVTSDIPMMNLGNFGLDGQFRQEKVKFYDGDYKERHIVEVGQLIMANTDMTQDRAILGLPLFVPDLGQDKAIFTHHTFCLDFNADYPESDWKLYIYYFVSRPEFRAIAEGYATGTTVLALPKTALLKCECTLPSRALVDKFNHYIEPIKGMINTKVEECKTLSSTRDTLLPKLLSGELRVDQAAQQLAEVS